MSTEPKKSYRVRNWKEYNKALVERGSITLWISADVLEKWGQVKKTDKRGRPKEYADELITCALYLKGVYHLTFRGLEGFLGSVVSLLNLNFQVPDYSTIAKRRKTLNVTLLKEKKDEKENVHILVDSTGLKILGEGEWKVRQHGILKKRLWRKLHLAINQTTQMIEAVELTELGIQDCEGFSNLLNKIEGPIDTIIGDGAYDRFSCYEEITKRGGTGIFPPQHNAVTSEERTANKKKASAEAVAKRDNIIKLCRSLGRKEWKKQVGYHRRSLAETGMFRIKTILGDKLSSRKMENQVLESTLWCTILNQMTLKGMPKTETI